MEAYEIQEILRKATSGKSIRDIAKDFDVSKSTVQRCFDRINQYGLSVQQAIELKPTELATLLEIKNSVRTGIYEPDFEHIYCMSHIHGKKRQSLKQLWQQYRESAPQGSKTLGYTGFGRHTSVFARICLYLAYKLKSPISGLSEMWQ